MSAKIIYDTKSEIPTNLQSEAVEVEGKFELNASGLINKNTELLGRQKADASRITELETAIAATETEKANIERDLSDAKSKGLPSGHRAVSIEIAELGQIAKAEGFTKETLPETKVKIETFETDKANAAKREQKVKALKIAGVENADAFFDLKQSDALNFEFETVDDEEKVFVVSEKDGTKSKELFSREYLEKADGFKNVIPSLFTENQPQSGAVRQVWSGKSEPANEFEAFRRQVEASRPDRNATDNESVLAALSGAPVKH